jgi:restriction system protein
MLKKRTIKEAAIEALKRANKPLPIRELYDLIIKQDLYRFNAQDPQNILNTEIRRHCEGVDFPTAHPNKIFQILTDGTYWIKDVPIPNATERNTASEATTEYFKSIKDAIEELKEIHQKHTDAFKRQIINQLKQIEPRDFEIFSKRLLEVYGFKDVAVTNYTKDGGIDGTGKLKVGITFLDVAFQCKRWRGNVGRKEIDSFRGVVQGDYEQGIFFTTSSFSKEAKNASRKRGAVPIILIDGETLVDIMIEKKFGVESESMPVYINALDRALTEES